MPREPDKPRICEANETKATANSAPKNRGTRPHTSSGATPARSKPSQSCIHLLYSRRSMADKDITPDGPLDGRRWPIQQRHVGSRVQHPSTGGSTTRRQCARLALFHRCRGGPPGALCVEV